MAAERRRDEAADKDVVWQWGGMGAEMSWTESKLCGNKEEEMREQQKEKLGRKRVVAMMSEDWLCVPTPAFSL